MEEQDIEPQLFCDPRLWHFSVRRHDGKWLTRPEIGEGTLVGNKPNWSKVIAEGWKFDTQEEASRAAVYHGADRGQFRVIASPRKPGDWLKRENDWAIQPQIITQGENR